MLDQRNEVYALIAMVAYCQIVDFPTWARMTGWHGGNLGTCLLPPATSATGWRALQRKLVVAKDGLDTSALALHSVIAICIFNIPERNQHLLVISLSKLVLPKISMEVKGSFHKKILSPKPHISDSNRVS